MKNTHTMTTTADLAALANAAINTRADAFAAAVTARTAYVAARTAYENKTK